MTIFQWVRSPIHGDIAAGALGLFALTLSLTTWSAETDISTPPPISGRSVEDIDAILPADALARVELINDNLELVRKYMGKTRPVDPVLRVSSARPRETYSQALNLQLRANRLAFEQVRVLRPVSEPKVKNVTAYDVFRVMDSVLVSVLLVKRELGIDIAVVEMPRPETTTPTEVFNATVIATGAIDKLLYQRTGPSDTFQAVTSAVNIAAALHVALPDGPNLPEEPPFEAYKSPYDAFMKMLDCYKLIEKLASQKGIDTLNFDINEEQARGIRQSDINDIASLLVEELGSIHARSEAGQPASAYYPGKKFAAHVYQRVGLLKQILEDLVEANTAAKSPIASR